jgi:aldehyde dehydrogenase (NAD+)
MTMPEQLMIDGRKTAASDAGTFDVYDPSSGDLLATVAKATTADVDRAVQSAQAALESKDWGGAAPAERGRIMIRIAQALRDQAEELAILESRDNGKPLRQSRTDVQVAARYFEFFAGIADKIMGNTIRGTTRSRSARAASRPRLPPAAPSC